MGTVTTNETMIVSYDLSPSSLQYLNCLDNLNYTEFRLKMFAKTPTNPKSPTLPSSPSLPGSSGNSGQFENIFKTLMGELKALQLNQSIVDLYIKQMQACHTQVLRELDADRRARAAKTEQDIAYLMKEVETLKARGSTLFTPMFVSRLIVDYLRDKYDIPEDGAFASFVFTLVTAFVIPLFMFCFFIFTKVMGRTGGRTKEDDY